MQIPAILYVQAGSDAVPIAVAWLVRRPVRGARGWIAGWCLALVVTEALALGLALRHRQNLWVSYASTPVTTALILWGLSCYQASDTARLTVRLALPAVLAAWAALTVLVEGTSSFSRAAEPMIYLVCLATAAATLVLRSHTTRVSALSQEWFWVSAGVALYFGAWSAVGPLRALLVSSAPRLMVRAYEVTAGFEICAMAAIARGMACPAES